jgi:hypothetical protein
MYPNKKNGLATLPAEPAYKLDETPISDKRQRPMTEHVF